MSSLCFHTNSFPFTPTCPPSHGVCIPLLTPAPFFASTIYSASLEVVVYWKLDAVSKLHIYLSCCCAAPVHLSCKELLREVNTTVCALQQKVSCYLCQWSASLSRAWSLACCCIWAQGAELRYALSSTLFSFFSSPCTLLPAPSCHWSLKQPHVFVDSIQPAAAALWTASWVVGLWQR